MPTRTLLVLAILAALYGAPSATSAAGNDLTAADVTPKAGSTTTAFAFAVRYDGKFAATGVVAQVAGRTLVMQLSAGTPLSGTWRVTSTLPAGTWPVTFIATSERGNPPTLTGPTVTVAGASTPLPAVSEETPKLTTAPPPAGSRTEESSPGTGAGDGSSTDPAVVAPVATLAPAADTPVQEAPGTQPISGFEGPVAPGASEPGGAAPGVSNAAVPGGGGGQGTEEDAPGLPAEGAAAKRASDAWKADDGLIFSVLLIGLAGVAAVALVGPTVLLAARHRAEEEERAPGGVADATQTLDRRAARRGKVRLNEDPIVAALGLGVDDEPRRPPRTAGQVSEGPGERPRRRRSP